MTTPAEIVIAKCGGHQQLADMAAVDVSRVYRWTYSKARGGTDGLIPTRHQQRILDEAMRRGIDLQPGDFFQPSAASSPPVPTGESDAPVTSAHSQ